MLALLWTQTIAHCFDVAKKPLLSEIVYDIRTRAGQKNLPEIYIEKLVRALLLSDFVYDIRTLGSFVHTFLTLQEKATPERACI